MDAFDMTFRRFFMCSTTAISMIATGAQAATISDVQGEVLVNQGSGFKPIVGSAIVGAGATVMAGAGGSAKISYDDGCSVPVQVGRVEMVAAQSPCSAANSNPMTTGAVEPPVVAPAVGGLSTTTLVVGGFVAAGAIGGAVAIKNAQDQKAKNHAASP